MKRPPLILHLRDVLILPFTVTVIVPFVLYPDPSPYIPDTLFMKILGVLVGIPGLALLIYTIFLFGRIGHGTLAPWRPTRHLVVTGPYRYCRNPMITGVFFVLIGEALVLHSLYILVWAALFFLLNTVYFIVREEPDLYKRFGDEYLRYKEKVPRWIPRLTPYHPEQVQA
jgi:protein-S-isoprenylcysteine O-methyltransferase Ste14